MRKSRLFLDVLLRIASISRWRHGAKAKQLALAVSPQL
jgi:hypothetical protein